jgi:anti-sigma factor ChrR (cupin superfamily)
MAADTLKKQDIKGVEVTKPEHPAFFDPSTLPWTPWVMDDTWFKLMRVDKKTGGFTMFLKVGPGNEAPIHGHLGAVEAYVMEGEFGYDEDRGGVGSYVYEEAGINHMPTSPDGVIMFAIAHGPLMGYHEDGSIAVVIDGKTMYQMAKDNNAADHIYEGY